MGYLGSRQIKYLRDKPQFVKITKAGFYESMVHNVDHIIKWTKKTQVNSGNYTGSWQLFTALEGHATSH